MPYTTHQDLIARIEAAFPDVPFPKDKQACNCRCEECQDLEKELYNKRWTEFTPTETRYISAGTSLFNDEAFAYILPAYLRASLVDMREADVVVDNVGWCYIPYLATDVPHRNLTLFNQAQKEVIVDWLEWLVLYEEEDWKDLLAETPDDDHDRNELREEVREQVTRYRQKLGEWQSQVYGLSFLLT